MSSSPFRSTPSPNSNQNPTQQLSFKTRGWTTGLGSAVLLASVLGLRWSQALGQQLGDLTEEIFRGDRLPLLPAIPPTHSPNSPPAPLPNHPPVSSTEPASTIL